jgi:phage-related protein
VLAAKPYIKIYGNGSISLSVNSSTITIADVDGYVELDSETMNAYKGINLLNNKMTGSAFPELVPGDNTIAFTGTVTGAEIVPRWCTI